MYSTLNEKIFVVAERSYYNLKGQNLQIHELNFKNSLY